MSASYTPRRGSDPAASDRRLRLPQRKHGAPYTSYPPVPGAVNDGIVGFSPEFEQSSGEEFPEERHPETDRGWWCPNDYGTLAVAEGGGE